MITAFHVPAQENGGRYLFDPTECGIAEKSMCCSEEGFMDYPHIPEAEVMGAFIKGRNCLQCYGQCLKAENLSVWLSTADLR